MAAFDSNNGHVKHIKHWKPCLGALTCYFRTNNRLLINTSCMILPTGHWGMAAFNSNMVHVKHMTLWKPCLGALMCHLVTNNRLLLHALCVILPTGQWGTPHYCQPATGVLGHMKHRKPCLGALMCYFGTNNRFLIYASCVILPTGQRGTPHYSQPATGERRLYGAIGHIKYWKPCQEARMCYFGTNNPFLIYASCVILPADQWRTPHYCHPATEEWMHLTALWGTWNTSNIENHICGPSCVISGHTIVCLYMHYVWYSQPASEERHITPNRPLRNGCIR